MKSRNKIFARGISEVEFRQAEPTSETSFTSFGYCKDITLIVESDLTNVKDVTGNTTLLLKEGEEISIEFTLLQTSKDEIDLVRNIGNKVYSIRINGAVSSDTAHYIYIENIMFEPNFNLIYSSGERVIQLKGVLVKDTTLNYDVPLYVLTETSKVIDLSKCKFYFNGNLKLNNTTTKVLEVSGYRKHGEANNQIIWANGTNLQFTGNQDRYVTFPNLSLSGGVLIEFWAYMSSVQNLKIVNQVNGNFGFNLESILASNIMYFSLGNGTLTHTASFSTDLVPINQWTYFGIHFLAPNTLNIRINGSTITPSVNELDGFSNSSNNLILGKITTNITQNTFSIGKMRIHDNIGSIEAVSFMTNNFNTEKSIYGL